MVAVYGKEIPMSSATNDRNSPMAQIMIVALVALINVSSPLISKIYARIFHGDPVIPLTSFVINVLPVVLLILLPAMLVVLTFSRLRSSPGRNTIFYFATALICGIYLSGIALPFICFPIGLER